jgi:predicted site-specific integrase-resolvase
MSERVQEQYPAVRPEALLRAHEATAWLRCSRRTLRRLVLAGDITPIYIDALPRFDPADVRQLIEQRRRRKEGSVHQLARSGERLRFRPEDVEVYLERERETPSMREPGFDRARSSRDDVLDGEG